MRIRNSKIFITILLLLASYMANSQDIEYIKVPDLEKILGNSENTLYVVNFWATWCPPCVKEFPGFQKVSGEYNSTKVKFIMISLDFPSDVKTQLLPFLKEHNVRLKVDLMTDMDYNSWIDKVDSSWQGEIPATLLFNNNKHQRHFHIGELGETELKSLINRYI